MRLVCTSFGCDLVLFDGWDDHVHLLIEFPPTIQLSRLGELSEGRCRPVVMERIPCSREQVFVGWALLVPVVVSWAQRAAHR